MAIAGSGGWVPSNWARLRNGRLEFVAITQNKPKELIVPLDEAVDRLQRGEVVTVDARWAYQQALRERLNL